MKTQSEFKIEILEGQKPEDKAFGVTELVITDLLETDDKDRHIRCIVRLLPSERKALAIALGYIYDERETALIEAAGGKTK